MSQFVELAHDRFIVDLLYDTTHHMLNRPIYSEFGLKKCYGHPELYQMLLRTVPRLTELKLKLKIYDCYRPVAVQREMWKMLPDPRYIADPAEGSNHNRGTAVDLYLVHEDGTPLEFPTEPDGYYPGAEKDFDRWLTYLEQAHLSYVCPAGDAHKCANRDLLRSIMEEAGFVSLEEEWWHYEVPNAPSYPLVENYSD